MSELQRQEPQAQVDLPNTVPVTGTNGHAEQLHVRLRRLEEELKEARQCAAREKAHRERVEQSRDAAVASLKEAKETARKPQCIWSK